MRCGQAHISVNMAPNDVKMTLATNIDPRIRNPEFQTSSPSLHHCEAEILALGPDEGLGVQKWTKCHFHSI